MPVNLRVTKPKLKWSDFELADPPIPDAEAEAGFNANVLPLKLVPRFINKMYLLPADITVKVSPTARVNAGAGRTDELLAHEQLHLDIGIVCAKALIAELKDLKRPTSEELFAELKRLVELHLKENAGAVNVAYDDETDHSRITDKQLEWQKAMEECLRNAAPKRIMGWPL